MCGKTQYHPVAITSEHAAALFSSEAATKAREVASRALAPLAFLIGPNLVIETMARYEKALVEALLDFDADEVGELMLAKQAAERQVKAEVEKAHGEALDEDFVRSVAAELRDAGAEVSMEELADNTGYALSVKVG
jgi:hypothetical protein